MKLNIPPSETIEKALDDLIIHAQNTDNHILTESQAAVMLMHRGIEAASAPAIITPDGQPATFVHPRKLQVKAPTPDEVQNFCIAQGLKPWTKALGYIMNLRESCEHWEAQVKTLYLPAAKTFTTT